MQAVDEEEKHGDPVEDFDLELTNLGLVLEISINTKYL